MSNLFWDAFGRILGVGWSIAAFFAQLSQMQVFLLASSVSVGVLLMGIIRSWRKLPESAPDPDKKLGAIGAGPAPAAEVECDFAEFYMDLAKRGDFSIEQAGALYQLSQHIREMAERGVSDESYRSL